MLIQKITLAASWRGRDRSQLKISSTASLTIMPIFRVKRLRIKYLRIIIITFSSFLVTPLSKIKKKALSNSVAVLKIITIPKITP